MGTVRRYLCTVGIVGRMALRISFLSYQHKKLLEKVVSSKFENRPSKMENLYFLEWRSVSNPCYHASQINTPGNILFKQWNTAAFTTMVLGSYKTRGFQSPCQVTQTTKLQYISGCLRLEPITSLWLTINFRQGQRILSKSGSNWK